MAVGAPSSWQDNNSVNITTMKVCKPQHSHSLMFWRAHSDTLLRHIRIGWPVLSCWGNCAVTSPLLPPTITLGFYFEVRSDSWRWLVNQTFLITDGVVLGQSIRPGTSLTSSKKETTLEAMVPFDAFSKIWFIIYINFCCKISLIF